MYSLRHSIRKTPCISSGVFTYSIYLTKLKYRNRTTQAATIPISATKPSNIKICAMSPCLAISPVAIGNATAATLDAVATSPVTVPFLRQNSSVMIVIASCRMPAVENPRKNAPTIMKAGSFTVKISMTVMAVKLG